MTGIQFSEPAWFWLLLLPLFLLLSGWTQWRRRMLQRFAEPRLWPWIVRHDDISHLLNSRRHTIALIACLAIIAATGPYVSDHKSRQAVSDIAVVIDISASMAGQDLNPDRLSRARLEIDKLLGKLRHHRYALIAFAANAYRLLPMTTDLATLRHFMNELDTDMTRQQGSELGRALALARSGFTAGSARNRAILLVTDGDITDVDEAMKQARLLERDHIPLFIVGSATAAGSPVADSRGRFIRRNDHIVVSKLQATVLQQLATLTGGRFVSLADSDVDALSPSLQQLSTRDITVNGAVHGRPLFPWLIGASLLLLLWHGQRQLRAGLTVCLLATLLLLPPAGHAAPWDRQTAYEALQRGKYIEAARLYADDDSYDGRLGYGAAQYRQHHYAEAQAAFRQALAHARTTAQKVTALYNLGNAQLLSAQTAQARNSYKRALALNPMHKQAALNLKLIDDDIQPLAAGKPVDREHRQTRQDEAASAQTTRGRDRTLPSDEKVTQLLKQWHLDTPPSGDPALDTVQRQVPGLQRSPRQLLRQRIAHEDSRTTLPAPERPW